MLGRTFSIKRDPRFSLFIELNGCYLTAMTLMFNSKFITMKKIFALMLLCVAAISFSSCEKSDDGRSLIIGTWQRLNSGDSSGKMYWIFRKDNVAVQRYDILEDGILINSIENKYTYTYGGSYIDFKTKTTSFRYEVSIDGNKMRLGNEENGYFELIKIF